MQRINSPEYINPVAYAPLLETIARGESGGNYNAHFGNPANQSIRFTDMTIADVLEWQTKHVQKGNMSNAVGKYQIIQPTLIDITEAMDVERDEKFDEALQDRIAIALIDRRGAREYANNDLTQEEFAANLAKEWAALPKTTGSNPQESYYASDGINKSNTSVNDVYTALEAFQKSAKQNG